MCETFGCSLQMEVLNRFVQQLKFSEDSNFKSAGESLESVVSENVSIMIYAM